MTTIRPETTPLYTTSVYTFANLGDVREYYETPESAYVYRRNGNPNTRQLEQLVSALEGTEESVLAGSGMAAIAQACFALLRPGDEVLATEVLYGGTYAFFEQVLRPWGISISYLDVNDLNQCKAHLSEKTKLIYAETIANPLLQVTDLFALGEFAEQHGLLMMVDNTFATPLLVRPANHGCTVVVNSLTKYMNGHSDVIGGVCSGSTKYMTEIRRFSETFGSVLSPFDAWMTERGLQTFHLRVRQQCESAHALARQLQNHEAVAKVFYPGLPTHSTHDIAVKVLDGGFGAMISFELPGGADAADQFIRAVEHTPFAPSLGGFKSTLSHPGLTSHRAFSAERRNELGITDGVIRMSVGIEPFEEIWADVERGLAAVQASSNRQSR